ncbi:hypothetical protein DP129_00425 [Clostridium tetani]|uniref:ABC transporter permease n=1 Tax=Clostridium tetani TaxID=1513 RepID=UPI00100B12AA|nr:ABC transporter permease [Clostridium tetani]RXI42112.1 hypothetical protein DP129_00425 [Clostridium tetani]
MHRFQEVIYKPFSTLIIILSFIVGICSFQFGISLFNKNYSYYFKSKNLIKSTNGMYIKVNNKTTNDIISYLENFTPNFQYILDDNYEYQDKSQKINIMGVNRYYGLNKIIDLDEGRIFSESELNNNKNVVIIGNQLDYLTYIKNNKKCIKIYDKEFEVIGTFDKNNKTSFCYSLFVPIKAIPNNIKNKQIDGNIVYFDKKHKIDDLFTNLQLKDKDFEVYEHIDKKLSWRNMIKMAYLQNKNEFKYIIISLLISIINLITFSFLWTTYIKKSLIIKTVLGASKEDIIKLVLTQILTISLISYIIYIIIGYFSAGILNNYFDIQILSNTMNLMLNIIITIPMSLLCLIIVLINIFKSNLSEEIR